MPKPQSARRRLAARLEFLETRQLMAVDLEAAATGLADGGFSGGLLTAATPDGLPPLSQQSPSPDFRLARDQDGSPDDPFRQIENLLVEAHAQTGWNNVVSTYGLTGRGQTIAVIDSGIAYDHVALGGGFGTSFRVVGGWDFTAENDANPYDDGPSGSHGTHVAGIIGSSDATQRGVAPGVDLVALRVFDDNGNGYFSWVENALKWVVANRNSFANPITAVNLSVGVSTWNDVTPPIWANLEDELQQLEQAGIFIAVSAGNSYTSFNAPGLSYPACSPYVVPVMSTDDSGLLSYYSQRHSRAVAVPGRGIVSTVPDYKGNNNGVADDFGAKSGTSMAAPYMAGASALIREAMQFAGQTNVTQDDIYAVVQSTADSFFDAATNANYKRLNLWRAIDSLMPDDDFGSTLGAAHALGTLGGSNPLSVVGHIATLTDADVFSFTASAAGTASFAAAGLTHGLASSWTAYDAQGQVLGTSLADELAFEVAAGQTYRVAYATASGIGRYQLSASFEAAFTFTDWGAVASAQQQLATADDQWFRVAASQAGWLTALAAYDAGGTPVTLHLYTADMQLVDAGSPAAGEARVDVAAQAGDAFFLRILGANADVRVTLVNLVADAGGVVTVGGTAADDSFEYDAAARTASVRGVSYGFGSVSSIRFDGGSGTDSLVVRGTPAVEQAKLWSNAAEVTGNGWFLASTGVERHTVHGGGGGDRAELFGTAGNDAFAGWSDRATLGGESYANEVRGFAYVAARAGAGGNDRATFQGTSGNDTYVGRPDRALMQGSGYFNDAYGFRYTEAYANGGTNDRAVYHDGAGNDTFVAYRHRTLLYGDGFFNDSYGFNYTEARATGGGSDRAIFYDSAGNDTYTAWPQRAAMFGDGYFNDAYQFANTIAHSTAGGFDRAVFHDSAGDDVYTAWSNRAVLYGGGYTNDAYGFDVRTAHSTAGGSDRAFFYDSPGNDVFAAWPNRVVMYGTGYFNEAFSFAATVASATNGGNDRAVFYDSAGDDTFAAWVDRAVMYGTGFAHEASAFDSVTAHATAGGQDRAILRDSALDDSVNVAAWGAFLANSAVRNEARGFRRIEAHRSLGGADTLRILAPIDYVFTSLGGWSA
jgi:subtilisin family serine protease